MTEPQDFRSLPQMLLEAAADRADSLAVVDARGRYSHADLIAAADSIAAALCKAGLRRNDRVAVLGAPGFPYLSTYIWILRAGGCVVPLVTMATAEILQTLLDDCGARFLFAGADVPVETCARLAGSDTLRTGVCVALDGPVLDWPSLSEWAPPAPAPGHWPAPEDLFNIIYSSGTTGLPKGIVHDHRLRANQLSRLANMGYGHDTIALVSTPMYSNITAVGMLPTLAAGGGLVMMRKFDAGGFLALAEAERVTHAILVPVQIQRILDHPAFDRTDLSAFHMKLSVGAPLWQETKRELLDRWPGILYELYGLTEGGINTILNATERPDKLHTVGCAPPGAEIRIIDEEGRELPPGQVGEVVGRNNAMMRGYHNRPEASAEIRWTAPDGGLFYRSGDMGMLDEEGFLTLYDRKKDMIISGGFNVYAVDLEAVLAGHPQVEDVAVVGVPDRNWGETPIAFVVPASGTEPEGEELRAWANARLSKQQRINAVAFLPELPRNAAGKVLKRDLRQLWQARAASAA